MAPISALKQGSSLLSRSSGALDRLAASIGRPLSDCGEVMMNRTRIAAHSSTGKDIYRNEMERL